MLGSKCRKVVFGFACVAGSALLVAADGPAAASASSGLRAIAAALAIGLGALGAALAQARAAAEALGGIARNPSSKGDVFVPMILSLAFMEFQALLAFAIAGKLAGLF